MPRLPVDDDIIRLSDQILDHAYALHSELGPGCFERVYEVCLAKMLKDAGLEVERQKPVPLRFRGIELPMAFRADLVVDDAVVVELKAVPQLLAVHQAQLATYVRLAEKQVGLLLCFGAPRLRDGYDRIVHPDRYFLPRSRRAAGSAGSAGPREHQAERRANAPQEP